MLIKIEDRSQIKLITYFERYIEQFARNYLTLKVYIIFDTIM